jgi:hypothetical protein
MYAMLKHNRYLTNGFASNFYIVYPLPLERAMAKDYANAHAFDLQMRLHDKITSQFRDNMVRTWVDYPGFCMDESGIKYWSILTSVLYNTFVLEVNLWTEIWEKELRNFIHSLDMSVSAYELYVHSGSVTHDVQWLDVASYAIKLISVYFDRWITHYTFKMSFEQYMQIVAFMYNRAARVIQKQWRASNQNPQYKVCIKRLQKEFNDLSQSI